MAPPHPHVRPAKVLRPLSPRKGQTPGGARQRPRRRPPIGREFAAFRRSEHERIVATGKHKDAVRSYLACISFADAMVGKLLDALDRSAYAKNTVIVFWSDNGWHLGEKQHWHKSTLWQRSTHVPLLIAGPGTAQPGVARTQAVSLLDLYPTLVELCGLPKNPRNEGLSLVPQLRNPKARRPPAVITYLEGNHAVRTERWRYIRYRDNTEELYDCLADPHEWRNLAADPAHTRLKAELARHLPATNAKPQPPRTDFDFDFATNTYRRKGK
ncbi:MAG: sulfatase-like hydrolase/transferase [Acidobacteriota bacterium]